MQTLPLRSLRPLGRASTASCAVEWNPPPTQLFIITQLTNQHFQQPPGGMCWLFHVSRRLGCNYLFTPRRGWTSTTASCFAPLELIHPCSPSVDAHFPLLLIAHSLDPPQLLPFIFLSFVKKKWRINVRSFTVSQTEMISSMCEGLLAGVSTIS